MIEKLQDVEFEMDDYDEQRRIIDVSVLRFETLLLHFLTIDKLIVVNDDTKEEIIGTELSFHKFKSELMNYYVDVVRVNHEHNMVEIHIVKELN